MLIEIPIRTVSEANQREHWTAKHKRKKAQKAAVKAALSKHKPPELPVTITLTRIAPRRFDYDNLVSSFKNIQDALAEWITPWLAAGRADDVEGLTFAYRQEKGEVKEYKVRIEI